MTNETDPEGKYQPPSPSHLMEIFDRALNEATGGEPEKKEEIIYKLNILAGFSYLSRGFKWLSHLFPPKRKG